MTEIVLPTGQGEVYLEHLEDFARQITELGDQAGMKISSRGWCYQLEGFRLINKNQFDRVEGLINKCRERGLVSINFTAEEEGRKFSGVEDPDSETPKEWLAKYIRKIDHCELFYTPNWWDGEEYYIQMLVEKIDLKTLFEPVCELFRIPIATSKGWSSMLQRAEYARRFKEAEELGLKCVLLYCGDHDPDGLRISQFIRKNLMDLANIVWDDGFGGYDPENLIIDRFGLNYDFISENNLTWIDNLITGSGRNLASPSHKFYHQSYVQNYLGSYGARKCEANALIVRPAQARQLCRQAIEKYIGADAEERFDHKPDEQKRQIGEIRDLLIIPVAPTTSDIYLTDALADILQQLEEDESEE